MNNITCISCLRKVQYVCPCTLPRCCGCKSTRCINCCIDNFPAKSHAATNHVVTGAFICRRCGIQFRRGDDCCENSPLDRCGDCCEAYGHICCKKQRIRFINPPLVPVFVNPPTIPLKGSWQRISRGDALKILTKQVRINPVYMDKNKSSRYASVEIEVSNIHNATRTNEVMTKWGCAVVRDTSTGPQGFEINTIPACANTLPEQLEEVCAALVKDKAEVSTTCGLHVHVDCRDYGYQEVQRFLTLYNVIEPTLFAALHSTRFNNEYCKPCGGAYYGPKLKGIKAATKDIKKVIIPAVYGRGALNAGGMFGNAKKPNFHSYRANHYGHTDTDVNGRNPARYNAVSLHSYFLRGTIEFRMHHAAIDFVEVYGWTRLCVAIIDAVMRTSDSTLKQILAVTDEEIAGCKDMYFGPEVVKGLVVLSSLIHSKYIKHLVSKIDLAEQAEDIDPNLLPAQLFYNYRAKTGKQLDVEKSGLTEV